MKISARLVCVLSLTALLGCDGDDDVYDYYYDVPVTTAYWEDWSTSAVYGFSDPFYDPFYYDTFLTATHEAPEDPETAAAIVADNVERYFGDDCATVDGTGSAFTLMLSECTGLFANEIIDGALHVSFQTENDEIHFDIASRGLLINGSNADFTATATYSASGDEKTVHYTSHRSSTREGGSIVGDFETTLTWTAGSNCVTRNSTGEIMADARTFMVQVDDYTRCAGQCPTSGVVTLNGDADDVITLTFTGGGTATLERSNGDVETVDFGCD